MTNSRMSRRKLPIDCQTAFNSGEMPDRPVAPGFGLRKNGAARFIPAGDEYNSRGQRPRNAVPRRIRPWKGRFPLTTADHVNSLAELIRPLQGRVSTPLFPRALPPAINLRPSRARNANEFFHGAPSPARAAIKSGATPVF